MHINLRHLRTIRAIHECGSLSAAASQLGMTQSALSHQIKALEAQANMPLFVRKSRPLGFTAAGRRMLDAANRILPEITALETEFSDLHTGSTGRLYIAVECHACFDWLFPVLELFRTAWPQVELDVRVSKAFGALPALEREQVDLVISADPERRSGLSYQPLFDYEPRLLVHPAHPLVDRGYFEPHDFEQETLLSYPVPPSKLDVFTTFLTPAGIEPKERREVELTEMILMLVASQRGVSVLPDWVARGDRARKVSSLRLGPTGVTRRLYAAVRDEDVTLPFMAHFIRLARQEAVRQR